jgi:iron complex transport system substrate-binding protein
LSRLRKLALAAPLLLLAAAGCERGEGGAPAAGPGGPPATAPAPAPAPATPPRRIISLAPSLTETLFALGLGGRVIGVDDYSVWPPEVAKLPRLGGLFNPNLERCLSLHPDLAVLVPSEKDLAAKLGQLGIPTLIAANETLADVERSFLLIAGRCGVPAAGENLARRWRAELAPAPLPGSPKVMLSVGRQPGRLAGILAAGPGTFFDELLTRLGAVNAFADARSSYPQIGLEDIVARAPAAILELRSDPAPPPIAAALADDWHRIRAPSLAHVRVAVIAGDYVSIPGPRLPLLYRQMRAALVSATAAAR